MHVGIDLGTTFSSVAYFDKQTQKPIIINNKYNNPGTPSVLCFSGKDIIYGDDAKELQGVGEDNTIAFYKRNMGDPNFRVELAGKTYTAEDLSAIFLKKLISEAEENANIKIDSAVITVPAYFNDFQRNATIKAGEKAGLKVLRIINEPTAAAIAYGLNQGDTEKKILVYDLGGGTFDVTVVQIDSDSIKVLGTDGDHQLGGKDWDDALAVYIAQMFEDEFGIDLLGDNDDFYELLIKAEKAKKELTSRKEAKISVAKNGEKSSYTVTKELFGEITESLMERTCMMCEKVLDEIGISWNDINETLLVGGSTRMLMVHEYIEKMTGKPPMNGVNVDEAVALGAAIQAEIDIELTPTKRKLFLGGAEKQSKVFALGSKNITDVTAHSLGMVSVSDDRSKYVNSIIITKNTAVPSSNTKPFKLVTRYCKNNETEVYILQGESEEPLDCSILGKYILSGIDTGVGKETILDIEYQYDVNGVVNVSATQRETNKSLRVKKEEIDSDMSWLGLPPDSKVEEIIEEITVMLVIDVSGSMSGDPLSKAKEAAKKLARELDMRYSEVGVVAFSDDPCQLILEPSKNLKAVERAIDGMRIIGGTDEPITQVYSWLRRNDDKRRFMVILTDGSWCGEEEAIRSSKRCKEEEIEIFAVGIGSANHAFLKKIATSDDMALMTNLSSLSQSFSGIAQAITEGKTGGGLKLNR